MKITIKSNSVVVESENEREEIALYRLARKGETQPAEKSEVQTKRKYTLKRKYTKKCHICGKRFKKVNLHIEQAHRGRWFARKHYEGLKTGIVTVTTNTPNDTI